MLAEVAFRKGMDLPIYVTYFKKKELIYVIDAPIRYSELKKGGAGREEIAKRLLDRCNELGRMTFEKACEGAEEAPAEDAEETPAFEAEAAATEAAPESAAAAAHEAELLQSAAG
ncbi:MAG: hypothetical protein IIY16_01285 [Oscillospiraceae bacterium]|nr:hypothetical protein [Oscillospiraceae bacterium]